MYEFKLADLGEGMHEATVAEWLIKVGDTTKLDQIIARVETDKALVDLPAPVAGRVSEIRKQDGEVAKVGEVLVIFDTPGSGSSNGGTGTAAPENTAKNTEVAPATPVTPEKTPAVSTTPQPVGAQFIAPTPSSTKRPRVLAAPAVRKLAFELGVNLEDVTASNENGRVSLDDVRAYADRAKIAPQQTEPLTEQIVTQNVESPVSAITPQDERQPLTGLRKRIAEHMERSWRIVPHATAFDEVDGTALIALRQSLKPVAVQRGVRLTYMPVLVKLLVPALREFPIFNASLDEEKREIIYKRSYHIGIATDSPEGLLVSVIRDADKLALIELAKRLEYLTEAAQKRTLALNEVSGSTFTLNNVGSFGGSSGTPIINYPEVAILAVGRLQEKAIVQSGMIIARPMMPLALSFDHRVIDGAMAGKFLARFKEMVENPQQLMLDMV